MILIVDDDPSVTASLGPAPQAGGLRVAVRRPRPRRPSSWLRAQDVALVLQDMNFSRQTTGEEGLALLARLKALRPAAARRPDHGLGLDRARGRGDEGGRRGLRHQALDEPAAPAVGATPRSACAGARPARPRARRGPRGAGRRYDFAGARRARSAASAGAGGGGAGGRHRRLGARSRGRAAPARS